MTSTLTDIRRKVRRLTATPSSLQLPDSEIDQYIDTYYEQDMPAELKLWNLHETFTFYTIPNEDKYVIEGNTESGITVPQYLNGEYTLPASNILGVNPPVFIGGYESFYTQSRAQLYRLYPIDEYKVVIGTGNNIAGPYTFTLSNTPVMRRAYYISATDTNDVTRTLVDIPISETSGNLVASGTTAPTLGTINYITGAVNITTFGDTINTGTNIYSSSLPYEASRPTAMIFYNDYFELRPIPDKAYKVTIECYQSPSQALNAATDQPDIKQWWQLIAFGAALKVLEDRQDTETLANLMPRYDEQKQLALHRTILQQTPERVATIYTEQVTNFLGNPLEGSFPNGF